MNIIYFGNDWSAENRTSSHHIANQLSQSHRVLYVECPGLRAPKGNTRDLAKVFKKLSSIFKKPAHVSNRLTVYTLLQIPFHSNKTISRINSFLTIYLLKKIIKRLGFDSPILWFVVPHVGHLIGKLDESLCVYYCIDDYSSLPDVNVEAVSMMDHNLTLSADIVFSASRTLTKKKEMINKNVQYSPHGVDFEHFNLVHTKQLNPPPDIASLSKPIIGFFGLIEAWIDLTLITAISKRYSEANIVLIGHTAVDVRALKDLNNVYFLGKRPFAELPAYAASFDVCILPYVDNEQIFNCNPIKLKEYLATGKPIVSVDFPEIKAYENLIFVSKNQNEFLDNINHALTKDNDSKANERINAIRNQTWEYRVKEILNKINELRKV